MYMHAYFGHKDVLNSTEYIYIFQSYPENMFLFTSSQLMN